MKTEPGSKSAVRRPSSEAPWTLGMLTCRQVQNSLMPADDAEPSITAGACTLLSQETLEFQASL